MSPEPSGPEPMNPGPSSPEPRRREPTGREPTGREPTGREPMSRGPVSPEPATAGTQPAGRAAVRHQRVALVDLLDRVLATGVVVTGDITLSIADVDLVTISLRALVSSVRGSGVIPGLAQQGLGEQSPLRQHDSPLPEGPARGGADR
jgi:hypothetical protein